MIELRNNQLVFRFPEIHAECMLTITLHRTLRIPDDGKEYPLPPSLGNFPIVHVDDYAQRVPKKWRDRGGVAIPMWQSEAMWISFKSNHISDRSSSWPFAVKVACGKVSAVTGKQWSKTLKVDDYLVCPLQPWIDGFVTEEGQIKQFVAAPLGLGATVEGQITGKEAFGGLQFEVIPMNSSEFDARFPVMPTPVYGLNNILRSANMSGTYGSGTYGSTLIGSTLTNTQTFDMSPMTFTSSICSSLSVNNSHEMRESSFELQNASLDMGMGMGGRMKQQIFKDPYGLKVWSKKNKARVFVHMCNSLGWKYMTGKEPPTVPFTAADYTAKGYAWFHYYEDGVPSQKGTKELKKVKSVAEFAKKKGLPLLPENQSANISYNQVIPVSQKIRSGSWVK